MAWTRSKQSMYSGSTSATQGSLRCTTKTGGHTSALNYGSPRRQVGLSSKTIKLAAIALHARRPISEVVSTTSRFSARRVDQDLPQPPEVRSAGAGRMPSRSASAPNSLPPRKLLYAAIHFYKLLIETEWFQILDARSLVRAERTGEELFIHVYILVMAPPNRQLLSPGAC